MSGELILVVDDNPLNRKLLRFMLKRDAYVVAEAEDAVVALARIHAQVPALILMDIQLPGMGGLELTRLLKQRPETSRVPIIAVTASAMAGDEERARGAGCDAYVSKPIDTTLLPLLVRRCIDLASANGGDP